MTIFRIALEDLHKADVLKRLVASATHGDVDAFMSSAAQLTWAGGWESALSALIPLGPFSDAVREAFQIAWHGSASQEFGTKRFLTTDLLGKDRLLLDGLSALLPPVSPDPLPQTLYRAQSLRDCRAGHVGPWWTPDRDFALSLWAMTSAPAEHVGRHALLVTEAPATAAVYRAAYDAEVLLDPRRLGTVRMVGTSGPTN
ncbi:hypothetical protein ACFZ8E_05035 [Methylobacterium sp. HMF5984]|uniref:hypothetical protein n=1 Tax=Methylobacterium sp. HMF5984 TaxID=3367370 RepID=UPI00385272B7